jgi:hypothetical protein
MGRCDPGHSQVGLPRSVQSKKKRPEARPLSSLEVIQGLPLSGQARRRSGGGDYSGRQAAGGKGMNHRSRRKGIADWAMDGSCQAGNYRNAREEGGGDGENDSLAHIRQPLIRREQPTPCNYERRSRRFPVL